MKDLFMEMRNVQRVGHGFSGEAPGNIPETSGEPLDEQPGHEQSDKMFADRVIQYVERPEKLPDVIGFAWIKKLLMPSSGRKKEKKKVIRLDSPELTFQQKVWIGTRTVISSFMPLLLYMVLPAFMMYVGMVLRHWTDGAAAFVNASGNFYYAVGIILCFLILRWRIIRGGESFQDAVTLYWRNPDWKKAAGYMIVGLSSSIFLSAVFTLLPFFSGYKNMTESAFQRTDLVLAMLSVFITAPICEEIIFRGLMLNRLLEQFSERTAVLMTAFVFAVCHGNLTWMCYAFVMGWLLAFVSVKEDNIFYSIVMHMAFNLWTVIQLIIRRIDNLQEFLFGSRILIFGYGLLAFLVLTAWFRMNPEFTEAAEKWIRGKERI